MGIISGRLSTIICDISTRFGIVCCVCTRFRLIGGALRGRRRVRAIVTRRILSLLRELGCDTSGKCGGGEARILKRPR